MPARVLDLAEVGDHGEHDAHVALRVGAADGPQLRAEKFRPAERIADAAKAEERIDLLVDAEVRPLLVAADIQRANDEMMRAATPRAICRYIAACWSSVGNSSSLRKRYSVRSRPMPSAPFSLIDGRSSRISTLADTMMRRWSSVMGSVSRSSSSFASTTSCACSRCRNRPWSARWGRR